MNALPLLLVGGASLLLMGGGKKRSSKKPKNNCSSEYKIDIREIPTVEKIVPDETGEYEEIHIFISAEAINQVEMGNLDPISISKIILERFIPFNCLSRRDVNVAVTFTWLDEDGKEIERTDRWPAVEFMYLFAKERIMEMLSAKIISKEQEASMLSKLDAWWSNLQPNVSPPEFPEF